MTIPAVYSVCRAYPHTRFVMATQQVASSLFVGAPKNLVVIGADLKVRYRGMRGLWRLTEELCRDYGIDAFADLHDVIRTRIIGLFCRMRRIPICRIDKGRGEKRMLTRSRDKRVVRLKTSHERYLDVFRKLGFDFPEAFTSLFPDGADPSLFAGITPAKQPGEKWIAVAPFAKHQGKIYPPGLMKVVVDKLASRPATRIFLFGGGGDEQKTLENWASLYPNVTSMAGKKYGFPKELALLSHSDVMLSMDSANMHLASLVGLPVVSVWGSTHPYCGFTGWHQPHGLEVQTDLPCRPCSVFGNKLCAREDYACLRGISPETIAGRIEDALGDKKTETDE